MLALIQFGNVELKMKSVDKSCSKTIYMIETPNEKNTCMWMNFEVKFLYNWNNFLL